MKTNKTIYWISTGIVILFVGIGSLGDLLRLEAVKEATRHLGFPEYILPFFGTLKILGTICVVIPTLKRFREAAYAGIFFFFTGAIYSHIGNGDGFDRMVVPLIVLMTSVTSYIYSQKINSEAVS